MKAIAIIHERKPEPVTGILDTELSREDLLRIISRQHEQMQRMQEDYDTLREMNYLLERQNRRLWEWKFAHMKMELEKRRLI